MSWFNTGYESTKEAEDFFKHGGGGGSGLRRFWMPKGVTVKGMLLEDDPTTYWEHQFRHNGSFRNWEPCKDRNKMAPVCPICIRWPDKYPYFVGLHTFINMTPWTSKKGHTYCFGREIFPAKLGGPDKPGTLKRLERIKAREGRLRGLIIECSRLGDKSEVVGDEIVVVDRVDPSEIEAFGKAQVKAFVEEVNKKITDDSKKLSLDKMWERAPWEPLDFGEVIKPRSVEVLREMVGSPSANGNGDSGGADNRDEAEQGGLDEDIPY